MNMGIGNSKLLEAINSVLDELKTLQPGSQEYTVAAENLAKLYKLKLEEDKNNMEHLERLGDREVDQDFKTAQLKEGVKDRVTKIVIAGAELVLPLAAYGIWMVLGFKFEEEGTITSQTFKGLINRFRPTKK